MKNMRNLSASCLQIVFFLLISYSATAADLNQEKTQLKVDVDAFGRDVAALEKSILFPVSTRVEVFLSLDPNVEYTPQSVTLFVDGKQLASQTYTRKAVKSLRFGAVHTLWQGNIEAGSHQLQANFAGLDRKGEPVQGTATLDFEKAANQRSLEVKITSTEDGDVAVYSVKDWGDK